ncbi:hypothetical protein Ancab_005627 [Ancistrocladus abbreviatus]
MERSKNVVEVISSSQESKRCFTIIVDDFFLIKVAVSGDSNQGVDFLRYCHSLTSEFVRLQELILSFHIFTYESLF